MRIRRKLILGFVGVALLAVAVGAVSIFENKRSQGVAEEQIYSSISHLDDVWQLMEAQEHQEIAANNYIFLDGGLKERRADYFYEKERSEKIYDKYSKESCEHAKPLLEKYFDNIKIYHTKIEEVFKLHRQGADSQLLKEKVREANKYAEIAHEDALEPLIEHIHTKHIEPAKTSIAKGMSRAARVAALIIVIAVLLAISSGVFISRSIYIPLAKLEDAVAEVGKGSLDFEIEITSSDEIGHLAASFRKMTEDLKNTTTSVDNLNAANQQLQASRQQLEAMNEQLQSNEQQLRANNQQLQDENTERKQAENQLRQKATELARTREAALNMMEDAERTNKILNREITDRKRAEEDLKTAYKELEGINRELKQMQSQLVQNEKLASIGQLAAGVAHEMNTPIGFVASNFQTLESYVAKFKGLIEMYGELAGQIEALGNAELQNKIDDIKQSRDDMKISFILKDIQALFDESKEGLNMVTTVIQNLRDFSKIDQPEEFDEYDLNSGINATLVVAGNEIKYDADLKTDLGDLPSVYCNPGQINQVFLNILVNAAQAIKSQEREDKGTITVRTYATETEAVCEISDDGPGISPDNLSKIFDPFFTTRPAGNGTGLGLSVSHDIIVNKHNGQLLADSTVGEGTTFTIRLPIQPKTQNSGKEIPSDEEKNRIIC